MESFFALVTEGRFALLFESMAVVVKTEAEHRPHDQEAE